MTFREKLIIIYIKWEKKLRHFHIWGRRSLSLMIIPHSERHIFKVRLSNYMLLFMLILAVSIASLAIFPYILKDPYIKNREEIFNNYSHQERLLQSLNLQLVNLNSLATELCEYTLTLYKFVWSDFHNQKMEDYLVDSDVFNYSNLGLESYSNIKTDLNYYRKNLHILKKYFFNIVNLLEERFRIFNYMPQGSPLPKGMGIWTSPFGPRDSPFLFKGKVGFHTGQDLAVSEGTPIYATADGEVITAQHYPKGGLGVYVKLLHKYGIKSVYGHCRRIIVRMGQMVKRGQLIGYVGQTGSATGPHVHYEIIIGELYQKPNIYITPFID
jgi:hypothetical protein